MPSHLTRQLLDRRHRSNLDKLTQDVNSPSGGPRALKNTPACYNAAPVDVEQLWRDGLPATSSLAEVSP